MSRPRCRPAAHAGLCLLVLAGSTATTVRHTHAEEAGGPAHAHGFGYVGLADAPPPGPGHGGGAAHRHVLLFGVEFYAGDDAPGDGPPADDAGPAVGLPDGQPAGPAVTGGGPPDSASSLDRRMVSALLWPARASAGPVWSPAAPPRLCDRARGERSGVSRV